MAATRRKRSDSASTLWALKARLMREESARRAAELEVSKLEGRVALLEQEGERARQCAMILPELLQPITTAMGYSELLRRKLTDEPESRYVAVLCDAAQHCAEIARKLNRLLAPVDELL